MELLKILCCPETKADLKLADPELVLKLNGQISKKLLKNRGGEILTEQIDGGLIRDDAKYLYPIRQSIPILLIDEAIPLFS
jgi:uncharacterized protein YbaR (Trm112 family)